ncbi:hypothetical protein Zmor_001297 [Zophobas morio]|uniref:Uncharacterized protein n=1 Tax=Zophobas morio TaxID=2755281 RepID=A0AA38MSJ2_9CUCU|nr:hypothetical protein Zmor_001297 [Zophobas morio]
MAVESFLDVRTALMGESSLLTVSTAERRAHKNRSGAGYRKSRSGVQGSLEAESRWMFVKDLDRRSMGLNRGNRREWIIQPVETVKSVQ